MAYDFEPLAGALWRLDGDAGITRQRRQLTISNGLAWSQDRRTLYYMDSPTLSVMAFPLNGAGEIAGEPTICVHIPENWDALPDGMCIDSDGHLWIALFGGDFYNALGSVAWLLARSIGGALSSSHFMLLL